MNRGKRGTQMMIIKCKMCGGDVALSSDKTLGVCEYCGCSMTIPKADNEHRVSAFNRGNYFRRIGEFDKALAVYERIVQVDEQDAEAHWCSALCRFGIEYVEDPNTYEWFPTCHRVSFDSFLEDVDYQAAVEYSQGVTRRQYIKEGMKIAEVQKGILMTSQNAQTYDIFLCYKESDENGHRTRDSLLAQEIYYQLTDQGRSVFYSRITLEDVPGTEYEPYIFAALNSAKVMIVVGTKPEYLNAPWVKNEWSRFLTLMKKDRSKLMIPCYRDMDPYELPEQLGVLQAYDMSRIGFLPDLTRGISKVLDNKPVQKENIVIQQTAANKVPLLKRAFLFLEDGDWKTADEYCEKVLDMDPEDAEAYLGKLLAEKQIRKKTLLGESTAEFESSTNYRKAIRFGDDSMKAFLESAVKNFTYHTAKRKLSETPEDKRDKAFLKEMVSAFESLSSWQDADVLAESCRAKIREMDVLEEAQRQKKRLQADCQRKEAEQKTQKIKKTMRILIPMAFAVVAVTLLLTKVIPQNIDPLNSQHGNAAFETTNSSQDAEYQIEDIYQTAVELMENREYESARKQFQQVEHYKDSLALIQTCNEHLKDNAVRMMEAGHYRYALAVFLDLAENDVDCNAEIKECELYVLEENGAPYVTRGEPIGKETTVYYSLEDNGITVHSITRVELDNHCIRFTIDCTASTGGLVSIFNPPNSDIFMYYDYTGIKKGRQTFVFDILKTDANAARDMTIKLEDSWIYVQNLY